MTDTINWGILATGGIASSFTKDLRLAPGAEIVAVGSRTEESARAFADAHDIPRAHGSWAGLAADPDVDIVYIANTHNAHLAAAEVCLKAGKAVLCEKPLTLNRAQAQHLVDLAGERGLFFMEAMWMRTIPAIRKMNELIADGAIGPVRVVHADFCLTGPFEPEHRLRDPELAGGGLLDLGVYPVSFAHMILGAPESVQVSGWKTPEGVDAMAGLVLGYDNAIAMLSCGIEGGSPCIASVGGPLGHIELPSPFFRPGALVLKRGGEVEEITVPYEGNGMVHEAVEAMRCLREGLTESPLVPWRATLEVMGVLDEARARLGVVYADE
ncbi:Gfo/Idh/MocA family protein [Phytomonospora endophytica]|uniref:Putative dehydrogenase n=1 Tax=Phytomonospora endophytica TaxID=714109 RepID=A0A841FCA2_9ACTN|nr:Gfo/Idh/MocA family oxidoreductase [Phytomonospora endophytica]MBB6033025.1 putative dehydrogenase [Phytomonospora endophytica]GIG65251.1 oxidoreductase [Phytomonospora endophytica]